MALQLYRRHRNECEAGRKTDSKNGEFEEGRRGWTRCACLIHATGTLGGHFSRQSTGKRKWDEAKAVTAEWEKAGVWSHLTPTPQPADPEPPESKPARTTVTEAIDAFLKKYRDREVVANTLAKYKTFTNQLAAYCTKKGYFYIDQLCVVDMDEFYGSWKDGKRGKAKKLERLRSFVRFSMKRKWLAEDIAEDLEAPPGASALAQKSPFDDADLQRLYDACDRIGPPTRPGPGFRNWGGEDAKDFIYLSVWTGLRISDIATFDISKRLHGNDVFLRMHKTGGPLETWIPDWLVDRLRQREKIHGPLVFRCGVSQTVKQLCDIWRNKRLKRVFKLAGPFVEKPHPHRFRHTFARILLENGVSDVDVAELIGDTVEMVRKHYSKWIPTRQKRLTGVLQDAFRDQLTPVGVGPDDRHF
jgi:integrase